MIFKSHSLISEMWEPNSETEILIRIELYSIQAWNMIRRSETTINSRTNMEISDLCNLCKFCKLCNLQTNSIFLQVDRTSPLHEEGDITVYQLSDLSPGNVQFLSFHPTRYDRTTQRDRELIVECSNKGNDWTTLDRSLAVKYKTANSWIGSGETESEEKQNSEYFKWIR